MVEPDQNAQSSVRRMRDSIDSIDAEIIQMLAERFRWTQLICGLQVGHGQPAADLKRASQPIDLLRALAAMLGLDPDLAEQFHAFVVSEVIRQHEATGSAERN
jgi:chorismate mutase